MSDPLTRATLEVTEGSLQQTVLDKTSLPVEFAGFEVFREGPLDNAAMAEQGFSGNTAETIESYGRITGYLKELVSPVSTGDLTEGVDVAVATVVHLFDTRESVLTWMNDVFLEQFEENIGKTVAQNQKLMGVERLDVTGFHDEAVGIKAVQQGENGVFSSTVVDFRIGRILGVAFVVAFGDILRLELAQEVAHKLERQIVRVVLGSA